MILISCNLSPWKCIKELYFMKSLLMPQFLSPGRDIDRYLGTLIAELKELWKSETMTIGAKTRELFRLACCCVMDDQWSSCIWWCFRSSYKGISCLYKIVLILLHRFRDWEARFVIFVTYDICHVIIHAVKVLNITMDII